MEFDDKNKNRSLINDFPELINPKSQSAESNKLKIQGFNQFKKKQRKLRQK